ncbi:PleD family two-component system response regulator [Azonexus sp.]|uniref:response regulator n=1 Tax=Azonexus sp. TaxID=1872668 RepID=UPI0027B9BF35|nr:response regulator [Azonexus sp.]
MKIFVVDDDPMARLAATEFLHDTDHEIVELESGEAMLASMEQAPDLILLDIEMPGMNGIAACRAMRQAGHDVQVIFVSASDDLDTRLTAYDAGGNDYIVKPYAAQELARKIEIAGRSKQTALAWHDQAEMAQKAAFAAMSSMAEMGAIQDFLCASFSCATVDELARCIGKTLEQYELQGLVALNFENNKTCFSTRGECTALEISILEHSRNLERIFQFRDRLVINYPYATLLILNLPLHLPERIGRLRDHLAVLAEGAQARFMALHYEAQRLSQAHNLRGIIAELTTTLEDIEQHQKNQRIQVLNINCNQMERLTKAFTHIGLSEAQEEAVASVVQEGIELLSQLQDTGLETGQRLREVTHKLRLLCQDGK